MSARSSDFHYYSIRGTFILIKKHDYSYSNYANNPSINTFKLSATELFQNTVKKIEMLI